MDNLFNMMLIGKINRGQNLGQKVDRLIEVGREGLDVQPEDRPDRVAVVGPHVDLERVGKVAGADVDRLGELHVILFLRPDFREDGGEEVEIGQELRRQGGAVQSKIEITDAVGRELIDQQFRTGKLCGQGCIKERLGIQIIQGELRQAPQIFGRVLGCLLGHQLLGVLNQLETAILVKRLGIFLQALLFIVQILRHFIRIRCQGDRDRGRIIQQVGPDQLLKIAIFRWRPCGFQSTAHQS